MSGTDICSGTNMFLNPEISEGIRKKKIITSACEVVNTLNI